MDEKEYRDDLWDHRCKVQHGLYIIAGLLKERGNNHDLSKVANAEKSVFMKITEKLRNMEYGSEEYEQSLKELDPALKHHYQNERHHPEHFDNGINGMNLVDLVEMFCDWYAATKRHENGDIMKSIKINKKRFDISEQLADIFRNTVEVLDGTD